MEKVRDLQFRDFSGTIHTRTGCSPQKLGWISRICAILVGAHTVQRRLSLPCQARVTVETYCQREPARVLAGALHGPAHIWLLTCLILKLEFSGTSPELSSRCLQRYPPLAVSAVWLSSQIPHESHVQIPHGLDLTVSQLREQAAPFPACILEILAITVLGCKRRHLQKFLIESS